MTAAQVEAYVRALAREDFAARGLPGIEPSDAEVARGCATWVSVLLVGPDFDPSAPIEDTTAHFAEASAVMRERLVGK